MNQPPHAPGRLAALALLAAFTALPAAAAPVINEIMYRPGTGYPENTALEFIEIHNPDATAADLAGWAITTGADFTFPAGTTIPAGGYLVVGSNPTALQGAAGVGGVLGPWATGARLANNGETITLARPDGEGGWTVVDAVAYASEGDWATRTRDAIGGWSWVSGADGGGKSLERRNPRLASASGQNWAESADAGGTPGRANSVQAADIAPVITAVRHAPAVPTSADPVTISCEIADEPAGAPAVTLHWRNATTASPGAFAGVPMTGDGAGRFTATLGALANKQIVEFYVSATDGTNTRTWPAPSSEGQNTNCTYQVDNEVIAGPAPAYRLILTAAENAAFNTLAAQGQGGPGNNSSTGDRRFNVTLVATRGADATIRYLAGMRIRGNSSRNYSIKPLRISLPNDNRWDDVSDFLIGPRGAPWQYLAHRMQRAAGLVAADASPIEVRRQGVESTVGTGITADYGKLARIEDLNGEYLDNHWPEADEAQLYRKVSVTSWAYLDSTPANPDLAWSGWTKENNKAANDWADVKAFISSWQALCAPHFTGAPAGNVAAGTWKGTGFTDAELATVAGLTDLDYLARWFAVMTIMPNNEPNLSTGEDDDYAAAFITSGGTTRMYLLPHDMDTTFGQGEQAFAATAVGLFDATEPDTVQRAGVGPVTLMKPLLPLLGNSTTAGNAVFREKYFTAIRELFGTIFDADTSADPNPPFYQYLDNHLGDWVPAATRTTVKNYMTQRQAYLLQLIGAGKITPAAGTSSATSAAAATPGLRINEVLAANVAAHANGGTFPDVIELHNSGASAVDLAGKRLGDAANATAYTFPAGTTIAAGGYLVVYADSATTAPGLHSGFGLAAEGDAVFLHDTVASGGALLDRVEFGFQVADRSLSRTAGAPGTWALTVPTVGAANGDAVAVGSIASVRINEWAGATEVRTDEDFVELYNPLAVPVALGGARFTDDILMRPDRYRFQGLGFIAAGGHLVLDTDTLDFGLNGDFDQLFLVGENGTIIDRADFNSQPEDHSTGRSTDGAGSWSDFAVPTPGLANNTALPAAYAALLGGLRVTEIMYQPTAPSSAANYEFIELQNTGPAALDLSGVRFTNGIDYTFAAGATLAPNAYVVVCRNRTAFLSRYPSAAGVLAAGTFSGSLDNSGERIALTLPAPWDVHVLNFRYEPTWQAAASGGGASLVTVDPATTAARDWDERTTWAASATVNGNPGGLVEVVPAITSAGSATGTIYASFSYQITASGAPTSFGASGLPAGLNVDAATGAITGVPVQGGGYTVTVSASNASGTGSAVLALAVSAVSKITDGSGVEVLQDVTHQNGNVYDQVLLTGGSITISADPGQVTRTSYLDLTDDIVQVEFSGAGRVTIALAGATGPALPVNYNQAVAYMKGHATVTISGADETSNLSIFSVGRANAVNQALFRDAVAYDGFADLALVAITSANGRFGGLRTANASYFGSTSMTGVYAPGVAFQGPVYLGDISAFDQALPVLVLGSAADVRITGGDLFQANGDAVEVDGVTQLKFTAGVTSHGTALPAQNNRARLEKNGTDVTATIVVNPGP